MRVTARAGQTFFRKREAHVLRRVARRDLRGFGGTPTRQNLRICTPGAPACAWADAWGPAGTTKPPDPHTGSARVCKGGRLAPLRQAKTSGFAHSVSLRVRGRMSGAAAPCRRMVHDAHRGIPAKKARADGRARRGTTRRRAYSRQRLVLSWQTCEQLRRRSLPLTRGGSRGRGRDGRVGLSSNVQSVHKT